jgi:protease-4
MFRSYFIIVITSIASIVLAQSPVSYPEIGNDFLVNPGFIGSASSNYWKLSLNKCHDVKSYGSHIAGRGYILGGDYINFESGAEEWKLYWGLGIGAKEFGIGYIDRNIYFEGSRSHSWRIGSLIRPTNWISLGLRTGKNWGDDTRIGIALRPYKDFVTIWSDAAIVDRKPESYFAGVDISPAHGIHFYGNYWPKDEEYQLGFKFDLAHISLHAGYTDEHNNEASFTLSRKRLRSPVKYKTKKVKLVLSGDYSETYKLFKKDGFIYLSRSIDKLCRDESVEKIVIKLNFLGLSFAQLEEIRASLEFFRNRGGKIVIYSDYLDNRSMFLASVADSIFLNPVGSVTFVGVGVEMIYFRQLFDKIGVTPDIVNIGKYKTGYEQFTRDTMSPEMREEIMKILNTVDTFVVEKVSKGRGVSITTVREWIDNAPQNASDAKESGIVDELIHWNEFMKESDWKKSVEFSTYVFEKNELADIWSKPPRIAVIPFEGSIVTGSSSRGGLFSSKSMGDKSIIKTIEKVAKDRNVKGIILRINSGGGSAFASEEIWQAVKKAAEKKPVWVSMGRMAGSGGYYVATPAEKIYASKTTITGSIGVYGGKFSLSNLFDKLGLTVNRIYLSPNANIWSLLDTFTVSQRERYRKNMLYTYDIFKDRVLEGRSGLNADSLEKMAQGKIHMGLTAKRLGLIDEIGGFSQVVNDLSNKLNLKDEYEVKIYSHYPRFGLSMTMAKLGLIPEGLNLNILGDALYFNEDFIYLVPYKIELK